MLSYFHQQKLKGLSPRVRGNLNGYRQSMSTTRSIPARTGEPVGYAPYNQVIRVYPRAYGGTQPVASREGWRQGLSPRVRGNQATDPGT